MVNDDQKFVCPIAGSLMAVRLECRNLAYFVSGTGTIVEGVWGGNGPKINGIHCQIAVALFLEGWGRACHPLSGVLPSFKVTHGWQK